MSPPEADAEFCATEIAPMVTYRSVGGALAGAVYIVGTPLVVDVGDTEPQGGVSQETIQVTPLFVKSLVRVAVNCCVPPGSTTIFAEPGETATVI
ncbi:MAG: hypothetical protein LAO23_06950 [Acidobacteriia bacterium]|nr:hypothetical protein [Terriglobia bacterium]